MLSKKRYMLGKKGLSEKRSRLWRESSVRKHRKVDRRREAKQMQDGCRVDAERIV